MYSNQVRELAMQVVDTLLKRGYTIATAESCTGGSVAAAITAIAGCSSVYKGSVVAYCNEVKAALLGVDCTTLVAHGAVSEATVREMCIGVKNLVKSHCAIATSGIAGPGGGSLEKPVGTVWTAIAVGDRVETRLLQLVDCGRACNIEATVKEVLVHLQRMLDEE